MNHGIELSPVKPGEVLAGRYRVERVLGIGGMGVVVQATHLQLEQPVAIKFLLAQALLHPEVVTRFAREARAAVRIRSEHVSRVMDVGTLDGGQPYMVMEYLDGRDLSSVVRARGRLPPDEVVDYVLQASEAIAEAHRLGIVHRDLKPANLFLVESHGVGSVKVLDFGISKISGLGGAADHDAGMTQSASLLGSPAYMSPEQMVSARSVDARTDIWALGVIMYELMAGRTPFTGASMPEICIAITQKAPAPLRTLRPDVPPGLEAIVMRCLEKERVHRFENIEELSRALGAFAPPRSRLSLERIFAGGARAPSSSNRDVPASTEARSPSSDARDPSPSNEISVETVAAPGPTTSHPGTGPGGARAISNDVSRPYGSTNAGWGNTAASGGGSSRKWVVVALLAAVLVGAGFVALRLAGSTSGPLPSASLATPGETRTAPSAPPGATGVTVMPSAAPSLPMNVPDPSPSAATAMPVEPSPPSIVLPGAPPTAAVTPIGRGTPAVRPARPKPSAPSVTPRPTPEAPPAARPAPAKKPAEGWEDDR